MLSAWPWASCSTRWLSCVHASTDVPVTSLLETHPDILHHTTGHIEELLRVIGDMFHCEEDIDTIANVMLSCRRRNWHTQQPAALHHKFTYFCNYVGVDDKGMKRAWKNGVFVVPPVKLDMRLACMAEQLGATIDEAKSVVRAFPQTCGLLPATSELHIMQLHDLGFSGSQVKSMCLRQPVLLAYSYNSEVHVAKWLFLTCVLRLSHDDFVAYPHLLMSSLPNKVGPRWEYLRQLRLHGEIAFTGPRDVINSLASMSDVQFTARYRPRAPQMHVYDKHFQKQWQKRWELLLVDQQLSIQYIADNPDVLHISLSL